MRSYCFSGHLRSSWLGDFSINHACDVLVNGKIDVRGINLHSPRAHRLLFNGGIRLSFLKGLGKSS